MAILQRLLVSHMSCCSIQKRCRHLLFFFLLSFENAPRLTASLESASTLLTCKTLDGDNKQNFPPIMFFFSSSIFKKDRKSVV